MNTTEKATEIFHQWLNDAYSMELALIPILENHAKDLQENGKDNSRIIQHLGETKGHAELIKSCITRTGGDVSALKATVGKALGSVQSIATGMFSDELIKNSLSDFATENMEIAAYTSLREAARLLGDTETERICDSILNEEIAMAEWIQSQIPRITAEMLQHS